MEAGTPTSSDDDGGGSGSGHGERALVLTPTGRDAPLVADLLHKAGVSTLVCRDVGHLCVEVHAGAGVAVIAEEVFTAPALRCLLDELARQPAWSELPLIVLTAPGQTSRGSTRLAEALEPVANVTHLERPVRPLTLVSTVRTALRARRRQYQVRDLLDVKEQAIRDSQAGLRQRDEFLAMLGHELRNPLATISSCLHVMDLLGWEPGAVQEQRPVLERQTRHLARLVDDLLDVARITTGTFTLQKAPLDLAELVRRCAESMTQRFKDAGVTLTTAIDDARPVIVDGDAVRLEQVVTNLLTNAAKFTPKGGTVRVSVRAETDRSAGGGDGAAACATPGEAVMSVRDSGIGIPPDMLARVFDLFAQAHASIDRAHGGLGLGLTIVRRLIDLHGGSVTAHSDGPGRGTEFVARLPLLPAPAPKSNGNGHAAPPPGGRRVLLVEDNPDARAIMRRLLRLWGHEVEVAGDGPGGLDKALSLRPDVVVLDIGLPGFDGYEFARRLRSQGAKDVYLIAVTGYGQREDQERAIDAGFDAHLVKPVDPAQLSRLIVQCPAG